jgi:SAM-dependent methyltransferase
MTDRYVHGHAPSEHARLRDQAETLAGLLHADTAYPDGSSVLEAGCGAGAQTALLLRSSPGASITALDRSDAALWAARERVGAADGARVRFVRGDVTALPFPPASFDHAFVCFLLKHLPAPAKALGALVALLKPGGTLTAIEGDHGSTLFHPEDAAARRAIAAQVALQRRAGGDATIGRRLYPLLTGAGLVEVTVSPRPVYADGATPERAACFTLRTFTAMVAGVRDDAVAAGLAEADDFDAGLAALARTAEPGGTFCFTFFKGTGRKPRCFGGPDPRP